MAIVRLQTSFVSFSLLSRYEKLHSHAEKLTARVNNDFFHVPTEIEPPPTEPTRSLTELGLDVHYSEYHEIPDYHVDNLPTKSPNFYNRGESEN